MDALQLFDKYVKSNPDYNKYMDALQSHYFYAGFIEGCNQQDKQLAAYKAYVNGSITRSELDKALNND